MKLTDKWKDQRCFIIGGGASIPHEFGVPEETINEVIKQNKSISLYSPYMKAIHSENVIGINIAFELGDWVDVLFFTDKEGFYQRFEKRINQFKNTKVCCTNLMPKDCIYIARNKYRDWGVSKENIIWNHNAGAASISLAAKMGVSEIILLGFDQNVVNNNHHMHGRYGQRGKSRLQRTFERQKTGWKYIAKDAKNMGIDIYNASPDSTIKHFPKVRLCEIFTDIQLK